MRLDLDPTVSDALSYYNKHTEDTDTVTTTNVIDVQAINDWDAEFGTSTTNTITTTTFDKEVGLTTLNTLSDSIGVVVSSDSTSTTTTSFTPDGDSLALVASNNTHDTKSFTTDDATKTYTLGAVVDVDGVGLVSKTLTVSGTIDAENRSTLDLNGKYGFEVVDNGATLNIASMTVKKASKTGDGGAVYHTNGNLNVDNVVFNSNVATKTDDNVYGGAIYTNEYDTISESSFASNVASGTNAYGGAVYANASNTLTNNTFRYNSAVSQGGAIYFGGTSNIIAANNGTTLFQDNYVGGDTTDKQAIYQSGANNTLNLSVVNNGTMTFYDYITGDSGFDTAISGTAGSTLNLYNQILNSDISTSGAFTFNTANDSLLTYNFLTMTSDENTLYEIDVDLNAKESDVFKTAQASTGIITLNDIQLTDGDWASFVAGAETTQKIQILDTQNGDLKLALSTSLSNTLKGYNTNTTADVVASVEDDNLWTDKFGTDTTYTTKTLGLATSNTVSDSIGVTVVSNTVFHADGDPLALVAQDDTYDVKTFRTEDATAVYTLGLVDPSVAGVGLVSGTLNVSGTISGENRSTINLNNKGGFELADDVVLNLEEIKLTGNSDVISVTSADADVNIKNTIIDGNIINNGDVNVGENVTLGTVSGNGNLNINADIEIEKQISGNNVNVNNSKIKLLNNNSFGSSVVLNAKSSTVDIAANNLSINEANFDEKSSLSLMINSVDDFGSLTAHNMTVETGATLQATLAQGVVKVGEEKIFKLLSADNSDFNNFNDVYENAMYRFEKVDKNGTYRLRSIASAKEIALEYGAQAWVAEAAAAWVDGDKFDEGSVSADVANKLAYITQNKPTMLIRSLKALAPSENSVTRGVYLAMADRLFRTVESHLRGNQLDYITSTDMLSGVSVWARPYAGESTFETRGPVSGMDYDSRGVIAALEKRVNNKFKYALGAHYDSTGADGVDRDADVTSAAIFAYAEYDADSWFINATSSYAHSDYEETKRALDGVYKDKYSAEMISAAAIFGYKFDWLTAENGLRYYYIEQEHYVDTAGQVVSVSPNDILRYVAGLRFASGFGMIRPEIYFGITYDLMSGNNNTFVNLANSTSYVVPGKRMHRLGYEASARFYYDIDDNISIGLSYMGAFRRDYQEHTGMINLKYSFD